MSSKYSTLPDIVSQLNYIFSQYPPANILYQDDQPDVFETEDSVGNDHIRSFESQVRLDWQIKFVTLVWLWF